jgi:quercetin dioxygenase-like cupin family protein
MPNRPRHILRLLAAWFLTGGMLAAAPAETLVDNDQVRVVKVTDQPHARNAPHQHQYNRVMIYLQAGRQEIVTADGKRTLLEWQPGEVRWSPASGTHTSEVVSADPVTIIEVELKKPADPAKTADCALHPLRAAPRQTKLEFENAQVRVFRVKVGPREELALHEHVLNKVSVNLTPQNERIITADGHADLVRNATPSAVFGGPVKHREESLSDQPTETIVVELKN